MSARNDQEKLGNVNRRELLLGTSSVVAAIALTSSAMAQSQKAATSTAARRRQHRAASRISCSSWVTTSVGTTSAHTTSD